ncbi:hypothetical protein VPH35_044802 [Triticum aestivum]|uniref:Uncharacterized protein n=1 Tax=Triticum urartu TaxID=4572 RepID=A0A8R7PTC4_TRIUA
MCNTNTSFAFLQVAGAVHPCYRALEASSMPARSLDARTDLYISRTSLWPSSSAFCRTCAWLRDRRTGTRFCHSASGVGPFGSVCVAAECFLAAPSMASTYASLIRPSTRFGAFAAATAEAGALTRTRNMPPSRTPHALPSLLPPSPSRTRWRVPRPAVAPSTRWYLLRRQ